MPLKKGCRAPPGARGLKPRYMFFQILRLLSRSARGAWIETLASGL